MTYDLYAYNLAIQIRHNKNHRLIIHQKKTGSGRQERIRPQRIIQCDLTAFGNCEDPSSQFPFLLQFIRNIYIHLHLYANI